MGILNQIQNIFGKKNTDTDKKETEAPEQAEKTAEAEAEEKPAEVPEQEAPAAAAAPQPQRPETKNPMTIEQQQKWLRAVNEVFPALMVGTATGVDAPLRKVDLSSPQGPKSLISCIAGCVQQMNGTLGMIDLEVTAKRWPNLSDTQMLEAYEALSWYSHVLKAEYGKNIVSACSKVEEECKARNLQLPTPAAPVKIDPIATLRSMPVACVDVVPGLRRQWPAIDVSGSYHIFDSEEEAKKQGEKLGFETLRMTGNEMVAKLPEWGLAGMNRIILHKEGKAARVQINLPVYNAGLQLLIIRFQQAAIGKSQEQKAYAATLFNNLCHQIPQALFFVPIGSADEKADTVIEDNNLRTFVHAAKFLEEQKKKGQPVIFRGFPFAATPDEKPMQLRSIRNSATNDEYLAAFTDLGGALSIWKGHAHFAVATFDDLKEIAKKTSGLVLNPNSESFLMNEKMIDQVEQERNQQPKVFVFKKEEQPAPAENQKEV